MQRDPDHLLIERMLAPPPLEDARSSLDYWRRRRKSLPLYRRAARREAKEIAHQHGISKARPCTADEERSFLPVSGEKFARREIAEKRTWHGYIAGHERSKTFACALDDGCGVLV